MSLLNNNENAGVYPMRFKANLKNQQSSESSDYILGSPKPTSKSPRNKHMGLKVDPGMKYGLSHEAPSFFFGTHALVYKASYNNPHMNKSDKIEQDYKSGAKRTSQVYLTNMKNKDMGGSTISNFQTYNIKDNYIDNSQSKSIFKQVKPKVIKSYDCVNHKKVLHKVPDVNCQEQHIYSEGYRQVLKSQGSFKRTKEYFLDFVENNDSMNVYGPLAMKARPKKHREVKVYHLNEEETQRKEKIRNAMKSFVSNLSSKLKKGKSKTMQSLLRSNSSQSIGTKLVGIFASTNNNGEEEFDPLTTHNSSDTRRNIDSIREIQSPSSFKPVFLRNKENSQTSVRFQGVQDESQDNYNNANTPGNQSTKSKMFLKLNKKGQSLDFNNSNREYYNQYQNQFNQSEISGSPKSLQVNSSRFQNYPLNIEDDFISPKGNSTHYTSCYVGAEQGMRRNIDDYPQIGLQRSTSTMNQNISHLTREINEPPINSELNKSYSNKFKIGGVSKIPKSSVLKCLKKPKIQEPDGQTYLSDNIAYKQQLQRKLEKELFAQTLSSKIFKKPLIYQQRQLKTPKQQPFQNQNNDIEKFENTLSLHKLGQSTYSQGSIWFKNMSNLTQAQPVK